MNVNYLGDYESLNDIWEVHPEGGREGDYITISGEQYTWDKYTTSWVSTPPEYSAELRPISVTYTEGIVDYSEGYINYIGAFESLADVWEVYPEGGKEGDYILVGEERLKWNKYTNTWGTVDNGETTPARAVASVYGNLYVHNDVVVGEDLIAKIFETYATKKELSKVTPLRVETEDMMESMITSGDYDPEQIYYVPEEE